MPRRITFKPLQNADHYFSGRARVCRILEEAFDDNRYGNDRSQTDVIMQAGVGAGGCGHGNNFTAIRHIATGAQVTGPQDGSLLRIAEVLGLGRMKPYLAIMLKRDGDPEMYRSLWAVTDETTRERVQLISDYADSIGSVNADDIVFDEVQRRCGEAEERQRRRKLLGWVREMLLAEQATGA